MMYKLAFDLVQKRKQGGKFLDIYCQYWCNVDV